MRRVASAALLALTLSACGSVDLLGPPATYDLSAANDLKPARSARAQLTVAEPSALQTIDSNRIMVRASGGQVSYLSGAQWSDRLPRLVQVRLTQSFENARRITSVGRADDKLAPDVALVSEIRTFEIDAATKQAVVEISVKLVSERSGRIGAANVFMSRQPAGSINGAQASVALDTAMQDVLRQIVKWTVARV